MGISIWQIAIIALVILLFFGGAGKITRLMGEFGSGLRAFKKGISEDASDGTTPNVAHDGDTAKPEKSAKKSDDKPAQ